MTMIERNCKQNSYTPLRMAFAGHEIRIVGLVVRRTTRSGCQQDFLVVRILVHKKKKLLFILFFKIN